MARPLQLQVVTPAATAFSGQVAECRAPGALGEFGVLPEHASYLTTILPGPLRFEHEGKALAFAIGAGFIQVAGDRVTILTRFCEPAEKLDRAACEADLHAAEVELTRFGPLDPQHPAALARVQDARARMAAAQESGQRSP